MPPYLDFRRRPSQSWWWLSRSGTPDWGKSLSRESKYWNGKGVRATARACNGPTPRINNLRQYLLNPYCDTIVQVQRMDQFHPSLTTLKGQWASDNLHDTYLDPCVAYKVVVTAFHILAIVISMIRLAYRKSKRLLWWDDAFTAAAMITDAVTLVGGWFLLLHKKTHVGGKAFVWLVVAPPSLYLEFPWWVKYTNA